MTNGNFPTCQGLPDCEPPTLTQTASAIGASAIILGVEDYLVNDQYTFIPKLTTNWPIFISALISSILFVTIYIQWARRPRSFPDSQIGSQRNTWQKGILYGLVIGLLVVFPNTIVEVFVPDFDKFILYHALIEVATYSLAGVTIAYTLHRD